MTDSTAPTPRQDVEIFDEWPDGLRALFDGSALAAKIGFTASLLTTAGDGPVRTTLLGIGELYAPDSRSLCLALWPQARSARALAENRRAALTFVFDEAFYQVQLTFRPLHSVDNAVENAARDEGGHASGGLACFIGSIEAGEAQRVSYARLTSGIMFELAQGKDATLERWIQQVDSLKQAAGHP